MARCTLLCDIGNTNIKFGLALKEMEGQGLAHAYSLPTDPAATSDSLGLSMVALCNHAGVRPEDVDACVACSVAPFMDPLLREAAGRFFGCPVLFAQQELPVPLKNQYERPQEVGADRLVSAYAAKRLSRAEACISVDFGTATTFDCVSGEAYLGGLICPGVLSSARALATRTAKLPQIGLEIDSQLLQIGKSTSQSLNQGFIFGFASLTEGLCARLKGVLGRDGLPPEAIPVVATGGLAGKIGQACGCFDHVQPELLLEGLRLLYEQQEPAPA